MNTLLDPADPRLATLVLKSGAHKSVDEGMCFMEAVAWLRGQSFTDHPACVANTIGSAGRALNDAIPDEAQRTALLLPLIPVVVGTATTAADEITRAWLATDFLVREITPAWMECAGLKDGAAKLRALPPLTSPEIARGIQDVLESARQESGIAWAAAWDAARAAAWAAAWAAAGAAARDAAGDAAWAAAWDAARAAAWDAARAAAWDAAWDAARAAVTYDTMYAAARARLQPTADRLNLACADLIRRMAAVGRES